MKNEAMAKAAAHCGSQAELARRLNVRLPTVNQWVLGKKNVPATQCIRIEKACQSVVTRYDLRPDVFVDEVALAEAG